MGRKTDPTASRGIIELYPYSHGSVGRLPDGKHLRNCDRPQAGGYSVHQLLSALCLRGEGGPAPTTWVDDELGDSLPSGCFTL